MASRPDRFTDGKKPWRRGPEAMIAKPHRGRISRFSPEQKEGLEGILLRGARESGFPELWTLPRVAQLIEARFGVKYHLGYIWYILRDMGWSSKRPENRSRKRGEERRPEIEKAFQNGRGIVFLDKTGFMLQPVLHGPQGKRCRYNTVGTGTISPLRGRVGLYFQVYTENVGWEKGSPFLTGLHHLLQSKCIVSDRKDVRVVKDAHQEWFEVEWLPAYAPDLNPAEMVWNHTKYADLANFIPEDMDHPHHAVTSSLEYTKRNSNPLRSFFHRPLLAL